MASVRSDYRDVALANDARWEEEKKYRYNAEILTSLLREQVPVLDYVQWRVSFVDQGQARSVLPLISTATNQHCTHQAALLYLAADYTGGIALASLIPDCPVVGVHPVGPFEKSMALWLVKGDIEYFRPSVGSLEIAACVEPERRQRVRNRYAQGRTVLERIAIEFRNGDVQVGRAIMTYYARPSDELRCDGVTTDKVHPLYQHKLISSAELIAGVRARESGGLFEDPLAAKIAGEHGLALAARFCERSPQLGPMIAARTRHLDTQILEFARNGGRNLMLLGVGYDLRPFRLRLPEDMRIYELDFHPVLADRQQRLDGVGVEESRCLRIPVPIDLRKTRLADALQGIVDFASPIFIAWEGMSMYFEEAEIRAMLAGMAPLLEHAQSRLWLDVVEERAVAQPDCYPEVHAFMRGMQLLGEPFVFGVESPKEFLASNGFCCHQTVSSDVFLDARTDPVYSIYHFCTASVEAAARTGPTADGRPSWTAHPPHLTIPPVTQPGQTVSDKAAKN